MIKCSLCNQTRLRCTCKTPLFPPDPKISQKSRDFAAAVVGPCTVDHACNVTEGSCNGMPREDPVNHPSHYTAHPSGVECITVTEHLSFNVGNAVKYLWRAGEKGSEEIDLRKALWYVRRELIRKGYEPKKPA